MCPGRVGDVCSDEKTHWGHGFVFKSMLYIIHSIKYCITNWRKSPQRTTNQKKPVTEECPHVLKLLTNIYVCIPVYV